MSKKKRLSFLPEDDDNFGLENETIGEVQKKSKIYSEKYRSEQINTTSIENNEKSFSLLKKEYDININLENLTGKVILQDFYFDFKPPTLSKVYEFVSKTDYIRNDIEFSLSSIGRLKKIKNKETINENWLNFKNNEIDDIEFIQTVKKQNEKEYNNILKQGDEQFNPRNEAMEKDYERDLLYIVLFDKHLTQDLKSIPGEKDEFQSQLFPKVKMPIEIRYDIIKDTEETVEIRKVADALIDDNLIKEIEEQYNDIHKPLIHYSFSSYKLTYRVRYEINKTTRMINFAEMTIIEDVENNIQSLCRYK